MAERYGEYEPKFDPKPELDNERTFEDIVRHYKIGGYSEQDARKFALQRLVERTARRQKPHS